MSQGMVGRIFWKELRVQRAFWICVLGLGAFIQIVPILLGRSYYRSAFESHWFSSIDVVMACCFAAGSSAIAFAGETENRTKSLFQRLPVRISDLLVGKLGWSLLGTYSLFLILAIVSELCGDSRVASVVHNTRARQVFDPQTADFWYSLVAPLPFVVIGLFCSLGLREVLTTVTVTGAATALLIGTISREKWWVALVLLSALAVVDGLLVRYWLRDTSIASLRARLWRFAPSRTGLGHSTLSLRSGVAWRRAASSLLWKEWRQARPLTLTFAAVGTVVLLLFSIEVWVEFRAYQAGSLGYRWFKDVQFLVGIFLTLVPLFLGIGAGRADRRDEAYRLMANSGVSANAHWMAKHTVWLGLAMGTALWLLACERLLASLPAIAAVPQPLWKLARSVAIETFSGGSGGPPFGRPAADPTFAATLGLVVFVVALLYALGHLLSSIIPSAMTSLVLGLMSFLALALIWSSLTQLEVPFWWTIGLLPLIILLTGWLRTGDWLVERNSLAAWGRVAAGLMIPLVSICSGIIAFRVIEIPAATLPLELQSAQRQGVEGPALKQSPFVDAVKSLTGAPPRPKDDPNLHSVADGWEFADAATRDWVAANEPARKLALEAARQERGDFPNFDWPTGQQGTLSGERVMLLMRLLLDSARELESENKFEAALDNYVAIARLGDDLKRSDGWHPGGRISLRGAALEAMDLWAAQSNQTPALIKRAITRFQQFEEDTPSEAAAILKDWRTERAMVQDRVWRGNNINQESRSAAETGFVRWCLPWELLRLQRLQDLLFSTSLDGVQLVERQLRDRQFVDADLIAFEAWRAPWKWERATLSPPFESPSGGQWRAIPEWRVNQAALARMHFLLWAALDYRRERHKLPANLSELVPTYFSWLPIDPWTGEGFLWKPDGVEARLDFQALQLNPNRPFIASAGPLGCRLVFNSVPGNPSAPVRVITRAGRDLNEQLQPSLNFPAPGLTIPSLRLPPKSTAKPLSEPAPKLPGSAGPPKR